MSESLLFARGLKKTYAIGKRTLEVLRGVDMDVARGDFVALRGASGTGKSTLLHLLGGLDTPNAGEIHFAGQNLAAFTESQLTHFRNRRVGFVFQSYYLINEPELLLADEPTGNLDSHTGGEIIELLKNLHVKKQTTLIIATHDAKVAAHAQRVIELADGRIANGLA